MKEEEVTLDESTICTCFSVKHSQKVHIFLVSEELGFEPLSLKKKLIKFKSAKNQYELF